MTTPSAAPAPEPPATVPLGEIERELTRRRKLVQGAGDAPVLWARMSNLVIFCNSSAMAEQISAAVPAIAATHPARFLLLVGEPGPAQPVTARITTQQCPMANEAQAHTEQVTFHAGGPVADRLPSLVRSLLIGDLPTNLWWAVPQPPPLGGALLFELAEHAQQIVYDSIGWPDPVRGVIATADWLEQVSRSSVGGRWRVASDLNWRRLKYWRRLLGQALDPASAPGVIESVTELLVEHGPHAVIQAWELVSWLAQRLQWQVLTGRVSPSMEMSWRCLAAHGELRARIKRLEEGPPEIRRLRLACAVDGKPSALTIVVEQEQRLSISVEGVDASPRTVNIPMLPPAELVGRQLSDRERDPVFYESMAVAQVLARSMAG